MLVESDGKFAMSELSNLPTDHVYNLFRFIDENNYSMVL